MSIPIQSNSHVNTFFLSVKSKYYKKEKFNEYTGSGHKETKHTTNKKENEKTTYNPTMLGNLKQSL